MVVVPGTYAARIVLNGRTLTQRFQVAPDPRARYTAAQYASAHAFAEKHMAEFSRLDATLNTLDAYAASAAQRSAGAPPALAAQLAGVRTKALALRARLTADQTNDEDFIQRPGRIREDLGGLFYTAGAPPTAAALDYAARVDAAFDATMRAFVAFQHGDVARTDAALRAAGKPALATSGAKRVDVVGGEPPAAPVSASGRTSPR